MMLPPHILFKVNNQIISDSVYLRVKFRNGIDVGMCVSLYNYKWVTVKAAPHECVYRTVLLST